MNKWPSVYPRHLLGAAFDSAFNLRARFYFWARHGQGEPRPRGWSIEGPGCLPGPLRASPPKQHVGEGALGSTEWWGTAHSAVGCQGCLSASLQFGTPSQGLLGERVTGAWPWPGRPLCGLAAALHTPHSPVVHTQGCRVQTPPGDKRLRLQLVPTWSGIQPPWASVPPPLPQNPCVECREAGCCPSLNIQEPGPAFSLFTPLG